MSNSSTPSWTALPDYSRRWDNRMAAQHLPRDLVRPSSGLPELAQKKKNLPRCLRSIVTCGEKPTTATWSAPEPLQNCCLYTIKTNSQTIRSHVSQPASASKVALMNELEAHHCITPEQWIMLLCNVSFISASKLSLQELPEFNLPELSCWLQVF